MSKFRIILAEPTKHPQNETVYACNICDEGLDSVEEVRNHVKDEHREVVSHIISDEKVNESTNDEHQKKKMKECNDDRCLRLAETKCLCYYDDEIDEEG